MICPIRANEEQARCADRAALAGGATIVGAGVNTRPTGQRKIEPRLKARRCLEHRSGSIGRERVSEVVR